MRGKRTTGAILAIATILSMAAKCPPPEPAPKETKAPKTEYTNKDGMPIESEAPTGCEGIITKREYDKKGKYFTYTYKFGADCKGRATERVDEHTDLNSRCWEGAYFPACKMGNWDKTEPPGIRMPSDPATGG